MPVEMVNQPKCRCGRVKGVVNRWFLARRSGREFAYRDYDPEYLNQYDEAVCSMQCLDKLHHEHAQALVGMKDAGGEHLTNRVCS